MNRRQLLISLVVLAVVALGVIGWIMWSSNSSDVTVPDGATAFNVPLKPTDRALGNPKAPVTVVEYAAPTCPHCAHFDMTMFPTLKKNYIDTGKVYYVFRVLPLSQVDIGAEAIARCLPADNYFPFIDLLFRNQSKWDPDGYQIPDVRAALLSMAQSAGMSVAQANSCLDNADAAKAAAAVGEEAQEKYGVNSTPTFLVNGVVAPPFESAEDVKTYFDKVLAKK